MTAQLRFVLVAPQHPGNVGAAARALLTMGFSRLVLVAPQCDPLSPEAITRARGAASLLRTASIVATLAEALAPVTLAAAFTPRNHEYVVPFLTPEQFADESRRLWAKAPKAEVALVFGNEAFGLTTKEVWQCTHPVAIPANPEYPSLNLASAVQIAAYVMARALAQGSPPLPRAILPKLDAQPCTQQEIDGVVNHFLTVAQEVGFYDPQTPKRLEARLRRLLVRARLERAEANLLRGFFKACARAAADRTPSAIIEKNSQEYDDGVVLPLPGRD